MLQFFGDLELISNSTSDVGYNPFILRSGIGLVVHYGKFCTCESL